MKKSLIQVINTIVMITIIVLTLSNISIAVDQNEEVKIERISICTPLKFVDNYKDVLLNVEIYPKNATKKELTWSSSNEAIATVSQTGNVTTMGGKGAVVITATANDGSGITQTIELIVGKNAVAIGDKISLSFQTTYENIEWEIDDELIARKGSMGKIYNNLLSKPYIHSVEIIGKNSGNTKIKAKTSSGVVLQETEICVFNPIKDISVEQEKIELEPGETYKINTNILPNNVDTEFSDIYYLIDDPDIAKIDNNGNLIANEVGNTNIRIVSKYGEAKCTIPLKIAYFAQDLTINTDEINLDAQNDTYQLSYEISPNNVTDKSAIFTSQDDSIASVDKTGNIIARKCGSTVIKITTGDGRIEKEVKVNVSNFIGIDSLKIKNREILVTTEGKIPTFQAEYEILPANASQISKTDIYWNIADENIARIDKNGIITGIKTGNTTLTVSTKDGKYSDTCKIKVIKGYNTIYYKEIESYDSYGGYSAHGLDTEKVYYGETIPQPKEQGYTIKGMYLYFRNGKYDNKVDDNTKLNGDGNGYDVYVVRSKNRITNLNIKDSYSIFNGDKIDFTYNANFNNAIHDTLRLSSSNTKVIASDGIAYYQSDPKGSNVLEGHIGGIIKGTGTTTIDIWNEEGMRLASKRITIIDYGNKDYKVLDTSISSPQIVSINYINSSEAKIKLKDKVDRNKYNARLEKKGASTSNQWKAFFYLELNQDGTITDIVTLDKQYDYRVSLIRKDNYGDFVTMKSNIYHYQHVPPAPDFSVKSNSYNSNKITLGNNRSNYAEIRVYRATSKNGSYEQIGKINKKSNTYIDKGLTINKTYYYKLDGVMKENYRETKLSSARSAKPVLGQVSSLAIKNNSTSSIQLKWNKVSGASGYEVYMATSKNGKYKKVATITKSSTTTYKKTKLSAGKNYYFKVRAYKTIKGKRNYGAYSKVLETATKTKTPNISKVTVGKKKATVKWKKVSGATGYEVYMSTSKNGKYIKIATNTKNSQVSYTKTNLKSKKKYYFKIRTYKTVAGKKIYSSYSSIKNVKVK